MENLEHIKPRKLDLPTVGVVIVYHHKGEKWLERAIQSVVNQVYPGPPIHLAIIDNTHNHFSIGACFNQGVKQLEACEWILFLGDDDKICPEYVLSLMLRLQEVEEYNPDYEFVCVSSHTTIFSYELKRQEISSKIPTGAWKRSFLLDQPFNEIIGKWVDSELFARLRKLPQQAALASHQYGYFYRQHENNVSGNKFDKKDYDKERPKTFKYVGPSGIEGVINAKG